MEVELLFKDLTIASGSNLTQISLLLSEEGKRAGRAATLEALPEKLDRIVIDSSGLIMMPALYDHLSWIPSKFTQRDLSRHRDTLSEGGIKGGYFEVIENISRVSWLDAGRRILREFEEKYGLYGHQSYINRWKSLVGLEIPKIKMLLSADALKENREIALCPAQEHRASHISEDSPVVKLWWMDKQYDLIQEAIGERHLTQSLINDRIAASEVEKEMLQLLEGRDVVRLGTTIEPDCSFLISLILDQTLMSKEGLLGVPLRSSDQRRRLIKETLEEPNFRLAVGDYPPEWESDRINNGFNIGGFALPLLIDAFWSTGADIPQIFNRLYQKGTTYKKAGIQIPEDFVLLAKAPRRILQNSEIELDSALKTPRFTTAYTVVDNKLVFALD